MLAEFLKKHRIAILTLTEEKTLKLAGELNSSTELKSGLPHFLDNLIQFMKFPKEDSSETQILKFAALHGRELLRLNYSLSHVVHAYGAICQAITELAQKTEMKISAQEFNELNLCLDIGIAAAVSEYQFLSVNESKEREIQHLGFLVHELRNALSSATIAHEMIKQGLVGTGGSTARVLEENLNRMRHLIDRSLSDLRMRADPNIRIESFALAELVDQIVLTATSEARAKRIHLYSEVKSGIELTTDRQLLLSAIANLVQNAIKYSTTNSKVLVTSALSGSSVSIEVQDHCGGIEPKLLNHLFSPMTSESKDQGGMGLGLTISQRAISLLHGKITVRNNPGTGCVFTIEIPMNLGPATVKPRAVEGTKSVQPELKPPKDP